MINLGNSCYMYNVIIKTKEFGNTVFIESKEI